MKKVVLEETGKIFIGQEPEPKRKPGEALIKLRALGICGSDVNSYKGINRLIKLPLIPGHEAAGEVVETDGAPGTPAVGERVILDPYLYCGECISCKKGRTNCCAKLKVLGVQTDGAMREYVTHPTRLLHRIPDNLPWEHIPLAEPLTISLHVLHRAQVGRGDNVVIYGAGTIGVLAALGAKIYGARPILLDVLDKRLEKARQLGISDVVNSGGEDPLQAVAKLTDGVMADVVIEASGAGPAVSQVVHMAAYTGRVVLVGWPKSAVELDTSLITHRELTVYGSRNSAGEFPEAIDLISSGRVDAKSIVTEVIPFDRLPEAIHSLSVDPSDRLKIVAML
ncbi:MAG: alcohol dehydrogenase catalytic domain-containing protein [Synergistaceae bacterium]|jgi:2-desacetyl-2-hydroxyethyl bacteriochlorophyllide A dehydrogenase|nr:alcohol dehydrogenase catalytic domain-containing protein [Synergistaceae bacterium]